jgi:hypothetical protein
MHDVSVPRALARHVGLALALLGLLGSAALMGSPAGADPRVPADVWVQCTGFYGLSTQWPHPLTGCTSRSGEGSGQTLRTAPGTETIQWTKPFEGGKSLDLINITSSPVGFSPACPSDHPVAVNVSGTIAPRQQYGGSLVTATICVNATDFVLQPGTLFVIHKA